MSLLSLPNEVLLDIFSRDAISIPDLQSLMVSCHCLNNIIRASDELWKLKFIKRWGNFISQPPKETEKIWFEWTTLRCREAKEVQKIVQSMSSIAYPSGESPLIVINKLIAGPYPIPEFVQNELEEIISNNITENKTTTHYTRDALVKVRISILDKKWRDFMAQPLSQMSLFEGASLISQWATMGHGKEQTCVRDLEISIEDITERVEQLAFEMGYVSGTTDPKKEAGKILDLIKEVMFDEMRFSRLRFPFEHTIHYTCIAQVFERMQGCSTLLCAIYQEVARKMDIFCELICCFKLNNYEDFVDSVMTSHQVLLRWKDPAGSEDDNIYIDVIRGRSFKQASADPSLKEQSAASVDLVLKEMVNLLKDCFRFCIVARHDEGDCPVEWPEGWMINEFIFYLRLACSMSPKNRNLIVQYAKSCIKLGIHLDDAIQLLQSSELELPNLMKCCISNFNKHKAEITAAKTPRYRLPSVKFSVGLVVNFRFRKWGEFFAQPCVIVGWNVKFQESKEWKTEGHKAKFDEGDEEVSILEQTHYHILMVHYELYSDVQHQFNVPEETLEIRTSAVAINHDKIWIHFEKFDGRRYVPNAEKRAQFPEDEAVTLSLIG